MLWLEKTQILNTISFLLVIYISCFIKYATWEGIKVILVNVIKTVNQWPVSKIGITSPNLTVFIVTTEKYTVSKKKLNYWGFTRFSTW